jgi:hypothetical protein
MIAGRVLNQATGAPLRDAIVTLRFVKPYGPSEAMVRQTSESGGFSFTDLWGSSEWELSAECKGFAAGSYRATRYDPRGRFKLEKNQQIKDVILKLVPQAVIKGKVLDAEGKPMEGARVTLLKAGYAGGLRQWTELASADSLDNGEYRIPRVGPGRYAVKVTVPRPQYQRARSESQAETGYAATYHPDVTDPSLASPVDVSDGREIGGVDVQLVPIRLFHVRGRLQPSVDSQLAGLLTLVDRVDPTKVVATVSAWAPDYVFDLDRIPPGSYLAHGKLLATPLVQGVQTLDVADQDIDGVILRLARPDPISGVVRPKSDDRQVDLRKIAVRIPRIEVESNKGYTWSPVTLRDDMTFRVPMYFENFLRFGVQVSDLPEGCYTASIRYGVAEVPQSGIEYSSGAALVVTIGVDGGRVGGMTLGGDDQPAGRAVVGLFSADGKGVPKSLQADAQGAFQFSGIPPGDYKLIAWDDVSRDDLENPEFAKQFESKAAAISVTANGSATASLKVVSK